MSDRSGGRIAALLGVGAALAGLGCPASARTVDVQSPDRRILAQVSDDGGMLTYSVTMDGKPILMRSALGIRTDGMELGNGAVLGRTTPGRVDESYPFMGGKRGATNRARLATIAATTRGQAFSVDVHAADDGVAVRLRLPARAGRKVEADRSAWRFAAPNPAMWATSHGPEYENIYKTTTLSALEKGRYGLPLTARVADRWVVISEAALVDYGDIAIRPTGDGALTAELFADPKGWTSDREVVQPWRVTIVSRDLTGLVNSTLVQNLNPPAPAALANAPWIRPGRSSWQWLAVDAPIEREQHQWVDWTHDLGFEYYLVDLGWAEWKRPWESLADTAAYARTRGVKVWLWVHSDQVTTPEQRKAYLRRAASIGIVGVKVDFPPATNREWSNWYIDVARDAAAEKLMVDFHGATKPTGTERTWPNVLTREGVRGHEWHITRYKRVLPPSHDTILPFGRYVVGPGDYTPTVFEPKELQGFTWPREVAQMVTFTSPFLTIGGHPRSLIANPARDVVMAIPATWDETVVLPGSEPGKVSAMARRTGRDWFVAVINGGERRTLPVPLAFLGKQICAATTLGDADRPDAYDRRQATVSARRPLSVTMAPAGGFVAWIKDCRG